MTISMHSAFVPGTVHTLKALSAILGKAQAHCEARKIDPSVLLQSRLYPNMFPLVRQVQIACDMCKGGVARLAGIDIPKYEDTETTIAELQARIARTMEFMLSVQPEQIEGSEGRDIEIQTPFGPLKFKGQAYLSTFLLPNVYFHTSIAYALLRHNGVEVGKLDFLGAA
jgi:uncharacterized protein